MSKTSEDKIQIVFMNWCRWIAKFRDGRLMLMHHIPNGGKRSKREGHTFKLMGVVPGIPDLFLPVPIGEFHGLYIEFKTMTGRLSLAQKEVIPMLDARGYKVEVCRTVEQAITAVERYLNCELPRKESNYNV